MPYMLFLSILPPPLGSWFASTFQGATLFQGTCWLFPPLCPSKFDCLYPFPNNTAPGNTIRTWMTMMSSVTLYPLKLGIQSFLNFCPMINYFPGWLTVGTFISFRKTLLPPTGCHLVQVNTTPNCFSHLLFRTLLVREGFLPWSCEDGPKGPMILMILTAQERRTPYARPGYMGLCLGAEWTTKGQWEAVL